MIEPRAPRLRSVSDQPSRIVGDSAWARAIRAQIVRVANCTSNVLISGPTGTGKEIIAEEIHAASPRAAKPFLAANCACLPAGLFLSHMFGHLKGAFTGADYAAVGCFRAADGGDLFLDEVGELDLELQAKLLRVIQERKVTPLGSHEEIPVDVRIIAATNRNLRTEVACGRFRADLFYRLNVLTLETEPLSNRPEDLSPLVRHILARLAVENGLLGKEPSPAAMDLLSRHDWPGNVRELENVLERAVVFARDSVLGPELFAELNQPPERVLAASHPVGPNSSGNAPAEEQQPAEQTWPTLARLECRHIARTLRRAGYNRSAAARLLGVSRWVLGRKMRDYRLEMSPALKHRPPRSGRRRPPSR